MRPYGTSVQNLSGWCSCLIPVEHIHFICTCTKNSKDYSETSSEKGSVTHRGKWKVQQKNNNLTVYAYLDVDTCAEKSFMRPDLLKGTISPLNEVGLRTATGETTTAHGKIHQRTNPQT